MGELGPQEVESIFLPVSLAGRGTPHVPVVAVVVAQLQLVVVAVAALVDEDEGS